MPVLVVNQEAEDSRAPFFLGDVHNHRQGFLREQSPVRKEFYFLVFVSIDIILRRPKDMVADLVQIIFSVFHLHPIGILQTVHG